MVDHSIFRAGIAGRASVALLVFLLSASINSAAATAAHVPGSTPTSAAPVAGTPPRAPLRAPPIETMVISAHRLQVPLPTLLANAVLTASDVERAIAPSLAGVLRQQAGLDLTDAFADGSQTTLSLRGFGGDASANTLLVVDGQALNPADLSAPDLNAIALNDIERIEVLAGSSAVRYGDQATGGVIALATRPAGNGPSSLELGADSYDGRRYAMVLDGKVGAIGARLSGKRTRSDGYRRGADFGKDDGLLRLSYPYAAPYKALYKGGRVDVQLQRVEQDRLALGALNRAQVRDDPRQSGSKLDIHSRTDNARISWQQDIGIAHAEVDAYHTDFQSKAPSDSPTFGHALTLIERQQSVLSPRLLLDLARTRLLFGADANHERFRFNNASSTFGDSGNKQELSSTAAYAVLYQALTSSIDMELGVRRAIGDNDATGFAGSDVIAHKFKEHNTAWETGAQWRPTPTVTIAARVASSFRLPKVDEQLSVFTGLKPLATQVGRSTELTVNYQGDTIRALLNLYQLQLRREIDFDPRADFFGDNINLHHTERTGVLASSSWQIADTISAGVNAHWIRARLSGGNTLPFVPKRTALLWLNWQPRPWLQTRVESAYTGPRYAIGDYANASGEQGGFNLINLGVRMNWRDFTVAARIDNFFARDYTELVSYFGFLNALAYQPGTGRRYMLTISYQRS